MGGIGKCTILGILGQASQKLCHIVQSSLIGRVGQYICNVGDVILIGRRIRMYNIIVYCIQFTGAEVFEHKFKNGFLEILDRSQRFGQKPVTASCIETVLALQPFPDRP